jgi:hypothetical protein
MTAPQLRGTYCLACGERWSRDPDKHLMSCRARPMLAEPARVDDAVALFRGSRDQAPRPNDNVRNSTRIRGYFCTCCKRSWSVYPQNHERGCSAAYLLARSRRDEAKLRYRGRHMQPPTPAAAPGIGQRLERLRATRQGGAR